MDGALTTRVYLTIPYSHGITPRGDAGSRLNQVSGYWTPLPVGSSERIVSSRLTYGCRSLYIGDGSDRQLVDVNVGNNFRINTGFNVFVPDITNAGWLGANLTLQFQQGTSRTWEFTLQNNLFGSFSF